MPPMPCCRLAWLSRACDQATDKVSEALVTKKLVAKKTRHVVRSELTLM